MIIIDFQVNRCVSSLPGSSPSLSDVLLELVPELEPSPAIMISPMSAFKGARSNVGRGAGRAGDKVKRSSSVRDLDEVFREATMIKHST